jgi:ferric-dicitrate binding protein FerR (iron transport regulator)
VAAVPDVQAAIDAWREADKNARLAERQLEVAWHQYYAKRDAPIPEDLVQAVADRRNRANAHLSVALALIGAKPRKHDHPGDGSGGSAPS